MYKRQEEVKVVSETAYSDGPRAAVKCYGADNVPEGVAIMKLENVGAVSYTHLDVYKRQS